MGESTQTSSQTKANTQGSPHSSVGQPSSAVFIAIRSCTRHEILSPSLNLKARRKFTLVYTDYFKRVHKTEAGRKRHCWEGLSISRIWICRFTEEVFRNTSENVKASTVHTLSVVTNPYPESPRAVLQQSLHSPKIQCLCLLMGQEAPLPHTPCSAAWTIFCTANLIASQESDSCHL